MYAVSHKFADKRKHDSSDHQTKDYNLQSNISVKDQPYQKKQQKHASLSFILFLKSKTNIKYSTK